MGSFRTALAAPDVILDERLERPVMLFGLSIPTPTEDVRARGRRAAAFTMGAGTGALTLDEGGRVEAEDVRRKAVDAERELDRPMDERRVRPVPVPLLADFGAVVVASDAPTPEDRPSVDAVKDEGGETRLVLNPVLPVVPNALVPSLVETEDDIDSRFDAATAGFGLAVLRTSSRS